MEVPLFLLHTEQNCQAEMQSHLLGQSVQSVDGQILFHTQPLYLTSMYNFAKLGRGFLYGSGSVKGFNENTVPEAFQLMIVENHT